MANKDKKKKSFWVNREKQPYLKTAKTSDSNPVRNTNDNTKLDKHSFDSLEGKEGYC